MLASLMCTLVLAPAAVSAAGVDEALLRRVRDEGPKGWNRWAERLLHCDAEFDWKKVLVPSVDTNGPDGLLETHRMRRFYNGNYDRYHFYRTVGSGEYESVVIRRGDEYWFDAERVGSAPFALTDLRWGAPANRDREPASELSAPFKIYYVHASSLLDDKRFTISSLSSQTSNGRELVRIEFAAREDVDPKDPIISGWAELSPGEDWAVRRYRVAVIPVGKFADQTVEYGQRSETFQPLRSIEQRWYAVDGRTYLGGETVDFLHCRHADVPLEFFSFAAVGLPELSPPRRDYLWLILLNVGLVLIVAAIIVARRRKRHSTHDV